MHKFNRGYVYVGPAPAVRRVIYTATTSCAPRGRGLFIKAEARDSARLEQTFGLTNFPISRINMLIQLVVSGSAPRTCGAAKFLTPKN